MGAAPLDDGELGVFVVVVGDEHAATAGPAPKGLKVCINLQPSSCKRPRFAGKLLAGPIVIVIIIIT